MKGGNDFSHVPSTYLVVDQPKAARPLMYETHDGYTTALRRLARLKCHQHYEVVRTDML